MKTATQKVFDFVSKLSPVKKQIGEKVIQGFTRQKLNSMFRDAYVSMVIKPKIGKGIAHIDKDYFDGKVYTQQVVKTTYACNEKKDSQKNYLHNFIVEKLTAKEIKKKTTKRTLTLCWEQCKLELKLFKNKQTKHMGFDACEMDNSSETRTYDKLVKNIKANKWSFMKNVYLGKISDKIYKAKEGQYANLFLDYCGTFTTFKDEIYFAIKHKIVEIDGFVWITVSRMYEKDILKKLSELCNKAGGNSYNFILKNNYRDGAPMSTIIIQRTK